MAATTSESRTAALRPVRPSAGVALLAGLLVVAAYAAFADGAAGLPEETWLQVALAVLAVVAAGAWLGPGALRPRASPLALAGLAVWMGLSLLWSVAPDRTWTETNRALAYLLVAGVALAVGSTVPRAIERAAAGWLVIACGVAVYALAGKVVPGVVGHATEIARLRAPLEYWNALALVCVLAAPVALRFATAAAVAPRWRIASLVALFGLLCTIGMTYSRGAILGLVVAIVVVTAVGGARLRGLATAGLAVVAAVTVLAFAWSNDALSTNSPPLAEQIDAGLALGVLLVVVGAVLALAGRLLLRAEARVRWPEGRARKVWRAIGALAALLVVLMVAGAASAPGGLGGTADRVAADFTEVRRDPIYEPGRLLTTSSANRWAWWREAAGAWSAEPVTGWGAGSFAVSRRLYRVSPGDVQQPHSLPMQFLAELGVVGALLGLGALLLLLAAGVVRVRRTPPGMERDLAGALLAASAAWVVHACADWDWDIPGVTVPLFLFLGLLGARAAAPPPASALGAQELRPGRPLAVAAAALVASAYLVSALLPAWSDARTDDALQAVERRTPAGLEAAAADAEVAARLNPLSVRPLFAAAAVAEARDRDLEARAHLLEAVERQPWSVLAWVRLSNVGLRLADRAGVERASRRVLELDPGSGGAAGLAAGGQGVLAPPQASATATGTPLAPGP